MAVGPFPLWRPVAPGAANGPSSLLPPELAEVAPIYRTLGQEPFGFTPREVDEMELWEIGEFLGFHDPPDSPGGEVTEDEFRRRSQELIEARVRAAQEGAPQPEQPASAGPTVTPAMIEALKRRRAERVKG